MMGEAQNVLITRTAEGTPAGKLMRMYWQPVFRRNSRPSGR
jgi:hypothetical protein